MADTRGEKLLATLATVAFPTCVAIGIGKEQTRNDGDGWFLAAGAIATAAAI